MKNPTLLFSLLLFSLAMNARAADCGNLDLSGKWQISDLGVANPTLAEKSFIKPFPMALSSEPAASFRLAYLHGYSPQGGIP